MSVSVYLLSTRYRTRIYGAKPEIISGTDWANIAAFAAVVSGLVLVMAVMHLAPMFAALYVFIAVGMALVAAHVTTTVRRSGWAWRSLSAPLGRFIDFFASMTSDLALLLATLSIMTGAFVITGVPTKVGSLLLDAAGVNLAAMVIVAFFFGALLGMGLPPAPTYIITALVIAPPMIKVGVNPWAVHFFAFFLGVWGEVTPPTSVSAAITSKIAGAPFLQTLFRAITICFTLFVLMAGVFTRPELVMEPGLAQIGALLLLLTATAGGSFSLQANFADRRIIDVPLRLILGALVLVIILHPDQRVAALTCIPVLLFIAYWIVWRRNVPVVAQVEAA